MMVHTDLQCSSATTHLLNPLLLPRLQPETGCCCWSGQKGFIKNHFLLMDSNQVTSKQRSPVSAAVMSSACHSSENRRHVFRQRTRRTKSLIKQQIDENRRNRSKAAGLMFSNQTTERKLHTNNHVYQWHSHKYIISKNKKNRKQTATQQEVTSHSLDLDWLLQLCY